MNAPLVIVGRPNVGKSTLFNRLRQKATASLTYDRPGITRDRIFGEVPLMGKEKVVMAMDTGGLVTEPLEETDGQAQIFNAMRQQVYEAIDQATLVLLVVDGRCGLLPEDKELVLALKKRDKDFWVLVNKCDLPEHDQFSYPFLELGVDPEQLYVISAAHGLGVEDLRDRLSEKLDGALIEEKKADYTMAIIGAPNAGKSTLLNTLIKESRALVTPVAGTTTDPLAEYFPLKVESTTAWLKVIDTAGIRRKTKIVDPVESASTFRGIHLMGRVNIVIMLIDVTKGITGQDRRLMALALEKGKNLIVVYNKWDLVDEKQDYWRQRLGKEVPWSENMRVVFISAKEKKVGPLLRALVKTVQDLQKPAKTSDVNSCLQELLEQRPLTLKNAGGKKLRIRYATRVLQSPPTFIVFANTNRPIPKYYRQYLSNGLRRHYNYRGTQVRLLFKRSQEA